MKDDLFASSGPNITQNQGLREPQRLAYVAIQDHFAQVDAEREIGVVLPVGCGKSGLIALAPFAVKSKRTLVIAPNLHIAAQLATDLTPSSPKHFYSKRGVLADGPYPEMAEIRGAKTNLGDLREADVVVTNIQQLQREDNQWLAQLDADFFDLILFDEAHHNVADSWELLRRKFPDARIVNVSATPARADGRIMAGAIIYSYPISEAVKNGYVKRVSGHRLNPKSLRYVRREDGLEVEVTLDEVRRLGEEDASFRRSIVSSEETLTTIVDASIRKLHALRERSGERRLKIIASALNMEHCKQVVAKYAERGMRADFVHSNLSAKANAAVHTKLESHELDVIVQVRKLGEGFDHPFLTVAAVFSIFANLSPFVQFVGRVMRVIPDTDPKSSVNDGVVVFHVGGDITGVWNDFQQFAEADQDWFAALVDEHIDGDEDDVPAPGDPGASGDPLPLPEILAQGDVVLEDLALLKEDPAVAEALRVLEQAGVRTPEQFAELRKVQPTKQATRQARRKQLDELVKVKVGQIVGRHSLSHGGRDLDPSKRADNFKYIKSALDRKLNASGVKRADLDIAALDALIASLDDLVASFESEHFTNG